MLQFRAQLRAPVALAASIWLCTLLPSITTVGSTASFCAPSRVISRVGSLLTAGWEVPVMYTVGSVTTASGVSVASATGGECSGGGSGGGSGSDQGLQKGAHGDLRKQV